MVNLVVFKEEEEGGRVMTKKNGTTAARWLK